MLISSYEHTVDTKGREFIPVKFRLDIGMHFFLTKGHDGCIRAYSDVEWEKVLEKLSAVTAKSLKVKRSILANTVEAEMDSQGRVLLPEGLRKSAMIFDKVKIVGMREWIEFWNPERFEQLDSEVDEAEEEEMLEMIGLA